MSTKVLIIDDEKPTRTFIRKMLESFDLNLNIYIDGENVQSGIEAIEDIQPDIVLLDIQMPDGNGFDVLRNVKYKNFEVIFITAFQEFAVQAIKFSALDYILKPIDAEELHTALTNAIQHLDHAAGARELQMAHVGGSFLRQAQGDHFVTRPYRAIDQHAICLLHGFKHMRLNLTQARRVE